VKFDQSLHRRYVKRNTNQGAAFMRLAALRPSRGGSVTQTGEGTEIGIAMVPSAKDDGSTRKRCAGQNNIDRELIIHRPEIKAWRLTRLIPDRKQRPSTC